MNLKTIHVTEYDIEHGSENAPFQCPVARAILRDLNLVWYDVLVSAGHIIIGDKRYLTPQSVKQFVNKFDDHKHVEPFEFSIDLNDFQLM